MPESRNRPNRRIGPVSARTMKKKAVLLQVAPGTYFKVRQNLDLAGMIMVGALPTPLLSAIHRIQGRREEFAKAAKEGGDVFTAMASMPEEDKDAFLELLRQVSNRMVIEPRVTLSKIAASQDEELLWLGGFSDIPGELDEQQNHGPLRQEIGDVPFDAQMTVFRFLMKEGDYVVMSDEDAESFRGEPAELADQPGEDGGAVSPTAVDVHPAATGGGDRLQLAEEEGAATAVVANG